MGNCCGQEVNNNPLELQITQKNNTSFSYNENLKNAKIRKSNFGNNALKFGIGIRTSLLQSTQTINFDIEKNSFTPLISDLISRYNLIDLDYSTRESKLPLEKFIEKIRTDQLVNIALLHNDDFTNSEYVIYDLRSQKKETFIKKFKHLNYKIKELQIASNSILKRVKTFLKDKKIIILLDKSQSLLEIEEFIVFITKNNYHCNLKILDNDLYKESSLSSMMFSDLLDKRINRFLPMIFAQLQYFPHIGSNKFVFIDYNCEIDSYCSFNSETSIFTCFPDFNLFMDFFNMNSFLLISTDFSFKLKLQNLNNNSYFLTHSMILENINSLESLSANAVKLMEAIGTMLYAIEDDNSAFILIDKRMKSEVLNMLLYIFLRKLLKLPTHLILNCIMENPVFSESFIKFYDSDFEKMEDFVVSVIERLEKTISINQPNFTNSKKLNMLGEDLEKEEHNEVS